MTCQTTEPTISAISSANELVCWGDGNWPSVEDRQYTQVSAGYRDTCAVDTEGYVWCTDMNYGQSRSEEPMQDVHFGAGYACGLGLDGHALCWGNNDYGQISVP